MNLYNTDPVHKWVCVHAKMSNTEQRPDPEMVHLQIFLRVLDVIVKPGRGKSRMLGNV